MVTQEAMDFGYSLLDATMEYNTKMILIFSLLIYSVVMFAFTFWIERVSEAWDEDSKNPRISRLLLKRFFRWIGGSYIFVFFLMFLFSYRGASLEYLLNLIYGLYIAFFGAMAIWGIMYFYDQIMEWIGLKPKVRIRRSNRR